MPRRVRALMCVRTASPSSSLSAASCTLLVRLALIKELLTYDTIESEHFIVRFKPGLDEILAPEMLSPDRRERVLDLYLVRPLSATDYVLGRFLAFFAIVLALVYSGQIMLQIGLLLAANDPAEYMRDNWLDIPRILGAGLLVAIFITTLPLAVSAFTDRRAYAAAFVIGLFIISSAAAGILTECDERRVAGTKQCEPLTGDAAKWIGLVDVRRVPTNVNDMIFGVEDEGRRSQLIAELPRIVPIGWYVLVTGGLGLVLWGRYKRLSV